MRILTRLMAPLTLCIVAGAAHGAGASLCNLPGSPKTVVRLAQLPAEIQSWLEENGPVSDPGGPFNATDLFDAEHPVPGQRLVAGQAGPDTVCLQLEKGGRGYHHVILQFQLAGGHWTLTSTERRMAPG